MSKDYGVDCADMTECGLSATSILREDYHHQILKLSYSFLSRHVLMFTLCILSL